MKKWKIILFATAFILLFAGLYVFSQWDMDFPTSQWRIPIYLGVEKNRYDADLFRDEKGFRYYDSPTAMVGIDVSAHQGEVDWQTIQQSGVDFVILRVGYRGYTDGGIFADPTFAENLENARAAGLKIGVYFFSQAISEAEAREEASFVLDALDGVALDLPVYFDWEFVENDSARTNLASSETVTDCAVTFCEAVEKAGYKAGVYFNQSLGYLTMNLGRLKAYDFWLAEYRNTPEFYYHFHMWQYSDSGTVPGISGHVDMNIRF